MINEKIFSSEVQLFLQQNISTKPEIIALQKSPITGVSSLELAQQLKGIQVAEKKIPFLITQKIIYPKKVHLEQSSSEKTAKYKSEIISNYNSFIDITGGLGIDFYFFSKKSLSSTYIETNADLFEIVRHNFQDLLLNAEYKNQSGLSFLQETKKTYDLLYVDPSRRVQTQKKFLIEDLEPNIKEIESFLLKKATQVMVKLSPMYDVQEAILQLQNIAEIYLIAVKNELKEMLLILNKTKVNSIPIHCVNISQNIDIQTFTDNEVNTYVEYSEPLEYLYLPNVSILKSKKEDVLAERFQFNKLHPNTHIFTSKKYIENFSGRVFKVCNTFPNLKEFKNKKINIISKNHPLSPKEITRKYKITEGGIEYLIFCQTAKKKYVLHCQKL